MIIDAHSHIGYLPTLKEATDNLIVSIEDNKIDFSLFSFISEERDEKKDSRIIKQAIAFEKQFEFYEKNKNKLGMLLWIRPNTESNYEDVDKFINEHKDAVFGIKIHPYCSKIKMTDKRIIPYLKLAEKYNLPVCVHTALDKYSKIKYLDSICKQWPQLNFIAAHGILTSDQKQMTKYVKSNQNLYVDTAWISMDKINLYKENNLMDKIIFGTDNPINGIDTLKDKIYKDYFLNSIKLDKNDYNKLMYLNAIKVYNIDIKNLK